MLPCVICKKRFQDGESIIPVVKYVTNERRGDFASTSPAAYLHLKHLTEGKN